MLGNPVLDAVLPLPASVHFEGGDGKAILKALAKRHLPAMAWQREKHGFSVPLGELFNGPWRDVAEGALARCERVAPFLRADAVRALWNSARHGRGSRRLAYTFVVLLLWLEKHPLQ